MLIDGFLLLLSDSDDAFVLLYLVVESSENLVLLCWFIDGFSPKINLLYNYFDNLIII